MAKRHPQGVCKWRRFLGHWTATALKHWTVIDSCWKIMALSWWSPASSQLAQKLECCLVHWSKSFHCYGHEDIGLSQLPVLRRLPVCQGLHCTTRCGRCGWQVWLRQHVSDGDVPRHAPAIFPWDLDRPDGSLTEGMLTLPSTRQTRSFRLWWRADQLVPPLHDSPWMKSFGVGHCTTWTLVRFTCWHPDVDQLQCVLHCRPNIARKLREAMRATNRPDRLQPCLVYAITEAACQDLTLWCDDWLVPGWLSVSDVAWGTREPVDRWPNSPHWSHCWVGGSDCCTAKQKQLLACLGTWSRRLKSRRCQRGNTTYTQSALLDR